MITIIARLFFLIGIIFLATAEAQTTKVVVIVNAAGPLAGISERDIRDIYLGEKRFHEGMKVQPVNYAEGPVKDLFISAIVRMTPKEYKLHWTRKIFQGGVTAPLIERRASEIIRYIALEPGGIGYVPEDEMKAVGLPGIKILTVIGQ
ncbi:MAG: hypothetical protein OEV28_11805 [Nitrospirota bacterium]|nr:hypothetical protein [Nitrospirota bacterium]